MALHEFRTTKTEIEQLIGDRAKIVQDEDDQNLKGAMVAQVLSSVNEYGLQLDPPTFETGLSSLSDEAISRLGALIACSGVIDLATPQTVAQARITLQLADRIDQVAQPHPLEQNASNN